MDTPRAITHILYTTLYINDVQQKVEINTKKRSLEKSDPTLKNYIDNCFVKKLGHKPL